jgi:Holliday junction DNA helicase RuvB
MSEYTIVNANQALVNAVKLSLKNNPQDVIANLLDCAEIYDGLSKTYKNNKNIYLKCQQKGLELIKIVRFVRANGLNSSVVSNIKSLYEGKFPESEIVFTTKKPDEPVKIEEVKIIEEKTNIQKSLEELRNFVEVPVTQNTSIEESTTIPNTTQRNVLRPLTIDEYYGQEKAKAELKILIQAARGRNEQLDHILLYGGAGLGKTTLAEIIANEMGVKFTSLNATAIRDIPALINVLKNIKPKEVVFIDEVHNLSAAISDAILTVLEDFKYSFIRGKGDNSVAESFNFAHFTFIGGTTNSGDLTKPFLDRFTTKIKMEPYSVDALTKIAIKSFTKLKYNVEEDGAIEIGKRSRGVPRIVNAFVKSIRDRAQLAGTVNISKDFIEKFFVEKHVDVNGLDDMDRNYLNCLVNRFKGGPASIDSLASATSDDKNIILAQIEPYLIHLGFINITSQGRIATDLAIEYLNKDVTSEEIKVEECLVIKDSIDLSSYENVVLKLLTGKYKKQTISKDIIISDLGISDLELEGYIHSLVNKELVNVFPEGVRASVLAYDKLGIKYEI